MVTNGSDDNHGMVYLERIKPYLSSRDVWNKSAINITCVGHVST